MEEGKATRPPTGLPMDPPGGWGGKGGKGGWGEDGWGDGDRGKGVKGGKGWAGSRADRGTREERRRKRTQQREQQAYSSTLPGDPLGRSLDSAGTSSSASSRGGRGLWRYSPSRAASTPMRPLSRSTETVIVSEAESTTAFSEAGAPSRRASSVNSAHHGVDSSCTSKSAEDPVLSGPSPDIAYMVLKVCTYIPRAQCPFCISTPFHGSLF